MFVCHDCSLFLADGFDSDLCLLLQVLEEFSRQVDCIDWPSGSPETINYKALDIHLAKYQVHYTSHPFI